MEIKPTKQGDGCRNFPNIPFKQMNEWLAQFLKGLVYSSLKNCFMATTKKSEKRTTKDPCWKGYEQVGEKKKNGKEVPNCVPEKKGKK